MAAGFAAVAEGSSPPTAWTEVSSPPTVFLLSLFLLLLFFPRVNRRGRRRPLGKWPSFAQLGLHLKEGLQRRDGTLEPSGITAEETLRRSRRIEINALLEILPKSANVLLWGSKLEIVYVYDQQSFGPGVPKDTGPVWDRLPAAS